jgi:hypothetical protein
MPEIRNTAGFAKALEVYKYRFTAPADGSETDQGEDLPAGFVITDVIPYVVTAEATGTTKTVNVGLLSSESGGDADGFLDGIAVNATGFVRPTLASAGQTLGAFLRDDESGDGVLVPRVFFDTDAVTAKSLSITAGSADFAELVLDVYVIGFSVRADD